MEGLPLRPNSVQCVVTSPPYFGLRRYGENDVQELGVGNLVRYLCDIRTIFRDISRTLDSLGVVWLNLGDSYAGSGGSGGDYRKGAMHGDKIAYRQGKTGIEQGSRCLVPQRIALDLLEDGWIIRQEIIWDKGVVKPEDIKHVKRPLLQHETIWMLSRGKHRFYPENIDFEKGNVWHISPNKKKKGSPAAMPDEIVKRCLKMTTMPGDIVFDPFAGSGTTLKVADEMGRIGIGTELYGSRFL
jgi:site-specific DNA-methyltransferase (cytosine-N4-specific)